MHHPEHDILTDYEKWVVDELVKYSTEGTNHLTNFCFERQWHLSEKASVSATKLFYASLFHNPKDARWAIDRICLLYTSPSPRDQRGSRMPSSA